MKKMLALMAGLMLIGSMAFAQVDPDENSFGFYFDQGATVSYTTTATPFASVSGYLVVVNPTSAGISGWECMVDVIGTFVAPSWTNAGGGLNVYDPVATGLFNVGVGPGALALNPVDNVCVLATWTAFVMDPADCVMFHVMPFPGSVTFADAPGYVDGDDVGLVVPCGISSGYPYGYPVAAINCPDFEVISNEDTTWSNVKAMFE